MKQQLGIVMILLTALTTHTFSLADKKVSVYTTANKSEYRISKTETLSFVENKQPLESEPCVFVDPTIRYQTFLGVGGALTDASAETFAKISNENHHKLLEAYNNAEKGIGYTLTRTNIASCDFQVVVTPMYILKILNSKSSI